MKTNLYEHFKGGVYKLHGIAEHTESGDVLAIYSRVGFTEGEEPSDKLWARPHELFFGKTKDGKQRFRPLYPCMDCGGTGNGGSNTGVEGYQDGFATCRTCQGRRMVVLDAEDLSVHPLQGEVNDG